MTTGCEPATDWWVTENGRWVVGDAGLQPEMVAAPASIAGGRPDTTCDGARSGDIDYRAVSLRGLHHGMTGKPRQDAYLLRLSANQQWLVGCVADGVSSGKFSHIAADVACREITRQMAGALSGQPPVTEPSGWEKLAGDLPWQEAVDRASAAIVARAAAGRPHLESGIRPDPREVRAAMATTAVAFAVATTRTRDGLLPFAVAVASGDSSALMLSEGRWRPLTPVKNAGGDLASNEVLALPRSVAVIPTSGFLLPGEALTVISDGIGDPLGQGTGMVGQFLAAHWSRPPDLFSFAGQAAFYRKGFTDDRTAAVVWHRPAGGPAADQGRPDEGRAESCAPGQAVQPGVDQAKPPGETGESSLPGHDGLRP